MPKENLVVSDEQAAETLAHCYLEAAKRNGLQEHYPETVEEMADLIIERDDLVQMFDSLDAMN